MGERLSLGTLDAVVVVAFVGALLALGFSARLRDASVLQFLAAGRSLTLPFFVATLVSTWYGGVLGIGEAVSFYGLGTVLLMGVPFYFFALFYAWKLADRVREADQISLPERIAHRWGRGAAVVAGVLVLMLALPAAHVLMLGVMVELFTGWPKWVGLVLAAGIGVALLAKGGLMADVRVSVLAFAMMYLGFAVMVVHQLATDPWPGLVADLRTTSPEASTALLSPTGGAAPVVILSFFILGAWTLVDPGFHQRVASTADVRTARRGLVACVGCWMVFDLLMVVAGMYALGRLSPMPADPLRIFPLFGAQALPDGLRAVFLCGLLGTITSAMVGYMLVSGASLGREIVARAKPEWEDAAVRKATRWGVVGAAVLAVPIAAWIPSVVNLWYQWAGAVVGALLIPVVAAYRGWRLAGPGWVSASMVVSAGVALGWLAYGKRTGNDFLNVVVLGTEVSLGTLAPGLAVSALVLAFGALAGGGGRRSS